MLREKIQMFRKCGKLVSKFAKTNGVSAPSRGAKGAKMRSKKIKLHELLYTEIPKSGIIRLASDTNPQKIIMLKLR